MNKVVSVIIPTYNTSHELLARAVASAASQEHVLEIIVVDDGSSESYLSSMSSVKDEHPSVVTIKHIKKAGVSAARNCGLECAQGDFIIFLDSDDELADGFISSAVKLINQYDADAVFGVGVRVYSETTAQSIAFGNIDLMSNEVVLEGAGIEVLKSSLFNGSAMTRVSLEPAKYVSNCGAIYRNSTIKSIRFREGITISEDRIFNFDFFDKASRIVLVGEIYYYYNCNDHLNRILTLDKHLIEIYKVVRHTGYDVDKKDHRYSVTNASFSYSFTKPHDKCTSGCKCYNNYCNRQEVIFIKKS
jgi:glycosyltransferase involved in cell wall biosynthesis